MSENNTKRLDHLDMVKGIGIFFVAMGHMEDISTGMRIWISSFHMPLFFIISGILMAVKDEPSNDLSVSVNKRFRGIIIPYLWFSLSYFVIDILNLNVVHNIDLHTFIEDTIDSAIFYGMSVLWFLPALFLASAGFLFLKKKLPDKLLIPFLLVAALAAYAIKRQFEGVYDIHADSFVITTLIKIVYILLRAVIAQSFVGYGYYSKRLFDRICDRNEKIGELIEKRPCALAVGALFLAINIVIALNSECYDFRNMLFNNIFMYYIAAFAGCFGFVFIFKAFPPLRVITYFGRNSLIVMACHINYYILYAGIKLAWLVDSVNTHAKHYVFVAVTMITVFALSAVVIEVINRFFPFVLGKKKGFGTGR